MFSGWYYHTPNTPCPVDEGVWVKVVDMDRNVLEGWSEQFDWSWSYSSPGNITQYCVKESEGMKILKDIISSIPDKGRKDILI